MSIRICVFKKNKWQFAAHPEPLVSGEEIFTGETPKEALAKAVAFAVGVPREELLQDDPPAAYWQVYYMLPEDVPEEGDLCLPFEAVWDLPDDPT